MNAPCEPPPWSAKSTSTCLRFIMQLLQLPRDTLVANRRALPETTRRNRRGHNNLESPLQVAFDRALFTTLCVLFDAHLCPKATGRGLAGNIALDPTIARSDLQRDFSKYQGKISGHRPVMRQWAVPKCRGGATMKRLRTSDDYGVRSFLYFATSRVTNCCSTSVHARWRRAPRSTDRGSASSPHRFQPTVFAAAFSLAMIAGGVPFGANRPFQPCASNSGSPASAEVGRSGNVASRTVEPTTRPFTSLSSIACETEAAESQTPSIWPPIASVSAGAAPR